MKYTLKQIGEMMPSGGRIVSMCEHKGLVMLATENHVFRGSFESGGFEQLCFYMLQETEE